MSIRWLNWKAAIAAARPGDRIVVADGTYVSTGTINVAAAGTKEQPIVIAAKTVGGVEIQGEAGFRLKSPAALRCDSGLCLYAQSGRNGARSGRASLPHYPQRFRAGSYGTARVTCL